ncbi:Germin-like protein subfamily 2 member 1 [Platanthera guangdongensis]|uniref:Germin-like protein subfamily 2 member 1 n=1 Tax=Platanthera guangdongensis TaxID=2320717 RepID=A0ABR2LVZ2_9ASPA
MEISHCPHQASSLLLLLFLLHLFCPSIAADPDPTQDFCVGIPNDVATSINGFPCKPDASVTSDDFFSTVLSVNLTTNNSMGASASFADPRSFPGLNTLGISMVRVDFAPAGLVTPPTPTREPRSSCSSPRAASSSASSPPTAGTSQRWWDRASCS